jgi:hypothetical protein
MFCAGAFWQRPMNASNNMAETIERVLIWRMSAGVLAELSFENVMKGIPAQRIAQKVALSESA